MQYNYLANERKLSIDAFRGITILVMIFVNELAGIRDIPEWMKHMTKDADAMSFVDVVFPAFLFIVGMSIPFAISNRYARGCSFMQVQQHILFRTLGLLTLGFFMVNAEGDYDAKAMGMSINVWALLFYLAVILIWKVYYTSRKWIVYTMRGIGFIILISLAIIYKGKGGVPISPRWWGILGLIGWAYLFSCIFYQLTKGNKYWLMLVIAGCIGFYAIGKMPVVENSNGWNWISDRFREASHTAIALCGVVLTLLFFDNTKTATVQRRFLNAAIFAALLFTGGCLLRPSYKISKIYATPTWSLYCAALCVLLFMFFYWLIDRKGIRKWTAFFKPAASNPLLTYILPDIIYYMAAIVGISLFPHSLRYGWPGLIWSLVFAVGVMGIVALLNRLKLKLQL